MVKKSIIFMKISRNYCTHMYMGSWVVGVKKSSHRIICANHLIGGLGSAKYQSA
jgi:hypothetical protein